MKFSEFIKEAYETLVISKCPACGAIVKYSGTLCDSCFSKYEKETAATCLFCNISAAECVCDTRDLKPTMPLRRTTYSYLFYSSKFPVSRDLIFALKRRSDRNVEKFFGRELSFRLKGFLERNGEKAEEWYITYPPRTRGSVSKYGFDHVKGLSKRIAKDMGFTWMKVFVHKGRKIQKNLNYRDRIINAEKSIVFCPKADVKDKKFIIVDDVMTTGATLMRCQMLLLHNGAKCAFPVSIAKGMRAGKGYDEAAQ